MTKADIRRVQADWVKAAERSRDAGFDIVYAYGAHTYLPGQFLSPFYNQRTDEYGGSLVNRARFWVELLEQLRRRRRTRLRDRRRASPSTRAARRRACRWRRASSSSASPTGTCTCGTSTSARSRSGRSTRASRGSSRRAGSSSGRARCARATERPIVGVGRLTNADQMAEIVRSGVWDIIGAARPSIADPFLPQKIDEGRLDEIRECIGCNQCIVKGDSNGAHRLHAERHRGRGVPPRLASGAVRARGERGQGRARGRRRAGRPGVRDRARQARLRARPRRHRRRGDRRDHALGAAPAGPGRVGPRARLAADPARRSCGARSS